MPSSGAATPLRKSLRLAQGAGTTMLEKAMSRKTRIADGTGGGPSTVSGPGPKGMTMANGNASTRRLRSLKKKSARCGVLLDDKDAQSLSDFVCSSV